jgi:hypothetical protein
MDMSAVTRYQAVREALFELGPVATNAEVAHYVKDHHQMDFNDSRVLSLYIAMVKRKMSRTGEMANISPSGTFGYNPAEALAEYKAQNRSAG